MERLGFEPSHLAALEPKSSVSANSTIPTRFAEASVGFEPTEVLPSSTFKVDALNLALPTRHVGY